MLGPFAYSSVHFAVKGSSENFIAHMLTDRSFLWQTALEAGLLTAFFFYLRWRGWTAADFKIRISWQGTLLAPVVAIAGGFANVVTSLVLKIGVALVAPHPHGLLPALLAGSPHIAKHSIEISWLLIFLLSTINAYLEELTFMGYAFQQFAAKHGPLVALLGMVFLRMLLHTYKGPLEMLGIASFSFVYGLAYIYLGRLWPLILGHAGTDIVAFSALKLMFGR